MLLVMVVSTFLGLLNPWFIEQLVDRILLEGRADLLWTFGLAIFGVALFRFGLSVLQAYVYAALTSRVLLDMRRDFLEHLQRLPVPFFAGARFGDIITRFNRDLSALQEISTGALVAFVTHAFTLVGTVAWAAWYDWSLFLVAALPFPFALVVARLFRPKIERLTHRLRELSGDQASIVVETITGMRTVRELGRERFELRRFLSKGHEMIRAILSFQLTNALASGLPRTFVVVASVIVYLVGGKRVIDGEMELGDLIATSMYVGMIFPPLIGIVQTYLQLVQARVSLERVREVRNLAVPDDSGKPAPMTPVRGAIEFRDVAFAHHPSRPLLVGASFALEPGETVALVGDSGVGKSTLVDLVLGFLSPRAGVVLVDGRDLASLSGEAWRRHVALVSHHTFLQHATLRENVRLGKSGVSDHDVERVMGAVGLLEVERGLPGGESTLLGERGERLSDGQRQRIALARALLRRPALLILDEATSALDVAADHAIREAIEELAGSATTLVISHRPESLVRVDRTLVLEGGRVTER